MCTRPKGRGNLRDGVCLLPWRWNTLLVFLVWLCGSHEGYTQQLSLEIHTQGDRFLLKPNKTIPVRIEVRDGTVGLEKALIQLDASSGRLWDLEDKGDGRYAAQYTMPGKCHPQTVILAAKIYGAVPAWRLLHLRCPVRLPVTTSPEVVVQVRMGSRIFGPVTADKQGKAEVPIVVRPGLLHGSIIAVDSFSRKTQRAFRLPNPPVPRLVGFANPTQVSSKTGGRVAVELFVVNRSGKPAKSVNVSYDYRFGALTKPQRIKPGHFAVVYDIPKSIPVGPLKLGIALVGSQTSLRQFKIDVGQSVVGRLSLLARPNELLADGQSRSNFEIHVKDKHGRPIASSVPQLRCEKGRLTNLFQRGVGMFAATFTSEVSKPGPILCEVSLAKDSPRPIHDSIWLQLESRIPARIEVAISPDELPMDGKSKARLRIKVLDSKDRPLIGLPLDVKAYAGSFGSVREQGQGRYWVMYTAPRGTKDVREVVDVSVGKKNNLLQKRVFFWLRGGVGSPDPNKGPNPDEWNYSQMDGSQ